MQLELKPFEIEFKYADKKYTANVEQTLSSSVETFTVTCNNKRMQIYTDRPLIAAIPGSRKKPKFKAVHARVSQQAFYETVIAAIQAHIYEIEHPPYNWSEHPKNMHNGKRTD